MSEPKLDMHALVAEFQQQLGVLGTRAAEHAAVASALMQENKRLLVEIDELKAKVGG